MADYLASNLSLKVTTAFEAHLSRCGDCAAFLKTYKKTIEATRAFLNLQSVDNRPKKLAPRPRSRTFLQRILSHRFGI